MNPTKISFVSLIERQVLKTYHNTSYHSAVTEISGRILSLGLSPAALLDVAFHGAMLCPSLIYACGRSVYIRSCDLTLPWQHLQRVQNSVAPLLFGSIFGVIHPYAGIIFSEPVDKYVMLGMFGANTQQALTTPCSPLSSYSLVERIGQNKLDGTSILSQDYIQILQGIRKYEEQLESIQVQEFIFRLSNLTLHGMYRIKNEIREKISNETIFQIAVRAAAVSIPVLTAIDFTIAAIAQSVFLMTGLVQLISGRGPLYTEMTADPLMHVTFFIQNVLKTLGNVLGSLVWIYDPGCALKVSLMPAHLLFESQIAWLMFKIRLQLHFAKDQECTVLPINFGNGNKQLLTLPFNNMHKTYVNVKKNGACFDLYWVDRPQILLRKNLNLSSALEGIETMIRSRFPYMDINKVMNYPVQCDKPSFPNASVYKQIQKQGTDSNCVISNLFGVFETLDFIKGSQGQNRNQAVRQYIVKNYSFYENDFYPDNPQAGYTLAPIVAKALQHTNEGF